MVDGNEGGRPLPEEGGAVASNAELAQKDVLELMEMRESIYRLFSALYFKEVTPEQIDFLRNADLEGLGEADALMEEGAKNIKRALHRVNSGTREDLAVDFAHTFLAAGSTKHENRACPYESVFTSRDGLIMQEARDEVYRYMLAEHVEPNTRLRIPEDHIAFIFEFMADLCARLAEALAQGDEAEAARLFSVQRSFFDEHIASWIDQLCDAIEACCRTSFYRGLSQMTRGFINVERAFFDEMADAPCLGGEEARS